MSGSTIAEPESYRAIWQHRQLFVGSAAKPKMAPPPWSLWSRPTASMQMGHQIAQAPSQPSPPFRAFHLGVLGTHFPLSALLLLFARAIFGVGHMTRFTEYEIGDCLVPHLFRTDRVHTWMVRLWSVAVWGLLSYFSSSYSVPNSQCLCPNVVEYDS